MPSHMSTTSRRRRLGAAVITGALALGITTAVPATASTAGSVGSTGWLGSSGSLSGSGSGSLTGSSSFIDDLVADARQQVYNITDSDFVRTPLAHAILRHSADTPVVLLGARLDEDCSMPQILTDRLSAAADLLGDHPDNPVIVTGGTTREDCPSEAEAMKTALQDLGVDNRIILEEKAGNTLQNVEYTAQTIAELGGTAIVVTSDPHYLRALKNYRDAGLRAFGYVDGKD